MPKEIKKSNDSIGKKIKPVPLKGPEIGIDTKKTLQTNLVDAADISQLDMSALQDFNTTAQTREQIYSLIDTMATDDTIAAILETYAEDATETNDKGEIVWAEATDSNVINYVNFLISSLEVDKNIKAWATQLCTYGDVYLRLYRESDYGKDMLFGDNDKSEKDTKNLTESVGVNSIEEELRGVAEKTPIKEDVTLRVHNKDDHYIHHVELVPNSSEMFELTKFGKTMGFIKASVSAQHLYDNNMAFTSLIKYKIQRNDVKVYDSTDFVHACLESATNRFPETVDIYMDKTEYNKENEEASSSYTVRKGQSLLYNSFRIWRELTLLENSVLLNRLTKSAIVRILNVDVGDMPKEQVAAFMERLKSRIEQKSAINTDVSMTEYTNPGPIENILYIPTHGTQGQISAQTIGGDVDPKALTDIDYFQNKLFGSLRVPKQFFAQTDDSAGFNGGSSLSIISSRYGKAVKRIQNTLCQMITDIINLYLWDKGLKRYINQFTIRMQAPITQEEIDKRTNKDNRIRYVGDIMQQLGDIETKSTKLKILKSLLGPVVSDTEVMACLEDEIAKTEEEEKSGVPTPKEDISDTAPMSSMSTKPEETPTPMPTFSSPEEETSAEEQEVNAEPEEVIAPSEEEDSYLPNPSELGFDATKNQ